MLLPKLDGSVRFCIKFHKLNEVTTFDVYPMPKVDALINKIGDAQVLSTIDLSKGYRQILLAKKAQEKTAFATLSSLYHFVKMTFGLHKAAASFQRIMDRAQGRP